MAGGQVAWIAPAANASPAETARDTARLERAALAHYPFVWRSLRRLGVAAHQVDDAAQQVFMCLAEKIDRVVPGCERAFVFQTAVRAAMAVRRDFAQRRESALGDALDDLVDPSPLPDAVAEEIQRRRQLDALLDTLPMELRTVFVLYEIEGLPSSEIAALLELPVGTVASRLRRAREAFSEAAARLRKRLERVVRR
jgi:RNA polymerase sigma-70 factor, ECF subfamily